VTHEKKSGSLKRDEREMKTIEKRRWIGANLFALIFLLSACQTAQISVER